MYTVRPLLCAVKVNPLEECAYKIAQPCAEHVDGVCGDLNVGYHAASVQMHLLAKYTNDWQVLTGMLAGGLECTKGIGVIDLYRERNFRSGTEPVMRTQLC